MNPNLSTVGFSFKGAYEYHGHDKGRQNTSERVDWFATRNLMTDDTKTAERIMIATAQDRDRLKREAGIKNTGRQSNAHVQTLSLSWHPDERVSRAEMEQAADEVIKRLELEDHQVAIFSHNDTKHQHVHLIINRVNPRDGRMTTLSNAKNKLDSWAREYERSRGKIVSLNREAKYQRQDAMKERYTPDERRAYMEKKVQKRAEVAETRRKATAEARTLPEAMNATAAATGRPPRPAEILRDLSEAQKVRHKQEWAKLAQDYKASKATVSAEWRAKFSAAQRDYDAQNRGKWKDFGRAQWKIERQRNKLEQTFTGRLALSITAAREQQQRALAKGGKSVSLTNLTWANLRNRELRNETFSRAKERDRQTFKRAYEAQFKPTLDRLNELRGYHYSEKHARFQRDRQDLMARQNVERQQVKEAWRNIPREGRAKEFWHEKHLAQERTPSRDSKIDVKRDPAARDALNKMRENRVIPRPREPKEQDRER